jgi:hypothetical protein
MTTAAFPLVFSPFRIGGVELRNRIFVPCALANPRHSPSAGCARGAPRAQAPQHPPKPIARAPVSSPANPTSAVKSSVLCGVGENAEYIATARRA